MKIRDSATVYDEDKFLAMKVCCDEDSTKQCFKKTGQPFLRNFVGAAIIKFLLELLSTRSFTKAIEKLRFDVPRFGAVFGSMAAIFHLTLCFFRRLGKRQGRKWPNKMSERSASLLAAIICTLPIAIGLRKSEMSLIKLIFFPLAWRCLCDTLIEIGLLPHFKHGEILGYMISSCLIPYSYMLERYSCPHPVMKMVKTYCRDPERENYVWNHVWMAVRVDISKGYHKGKMYWNRTIGHIWCYIF